MIFSKLAPELFPTIRPSVEYLAEEVPVPIPSADSEYADPVCCVVCNVVFEDGTVMILLVYNIIHNCYLTD